MAHLSGKARPLFAGLGMAAAVALLAWLVVGVLGVASAQTDTTDRPPPDRSSSNQAWFLRIDGIDGEAQDEGYKDWIDLLSVSHAIDRPEGDSAAAL